MTIKNQGGDGATFRKNVLTMSVATALACTAHAQAQEAVEEISITGSRIRMTSGMAEPVPVIVVTISELNASNPGASTVARMSQMPQFFTTLSSQRGSGTLSAGGQVVGGSASARQSTYSNLSPGKACTNVAGFVYQPDWFEGLRLWADGYDVRGRTTALMWAVAENHVEVVNILIAAEANLAAFKGRKYT